MTYVSDQTSHELRAHMKRLQVMPGWYDPLADRLHKEVMDQAAELERLKEALNLALEYWSDRQQRYKNRSPVWVQKARAALSGETT